MRRLCALACALVLAGCGSERAASTDPETAPTGPESARAVPETARGVSFVRPGSWERPQERISRISDPRELLHLATMPVRWRATDCEAFAGAAGHAMGRADAYVAVWERGAAPGAAWSDFPPRPRDFGPTERPDVAVSHSGCGEPAGSEVHWRNFADAGRHFHSLVTLGPEAPVRVREEAWGILDSLRVDPDAKPAWPSSG